MVVCITVLTYGTPHDGAVTCTSTCSAGTHYRHKITRMCFEFEEMSCVSGRMGRGAFHANLVR
jgi:hypothetical protein